MPTRQRAGIGGLTGAGAGASAGANLGKPKKPLKMRHVKKPTVAAVGPAGAVGPAPLARPVKVGKAIAKTPHPRAMFGTSEVQFTPKEARSLLATKEIHSNPKNPVAVALIKLGLAQESGGRMYPANAANASSLQAPVLKVLDQTTRPIHAIAAAADAAVTGKNVLHAAKQGIENKDKASFSRVLKHLGAPKAVQDVGGFVGDIGLDPTTYLTLGAAVPEKVAARAVVRGAERDAAKGITAKFAGHQVPGLTKATAKANVTAKKLGAVAAQKPVGRQLAKVAANAKDLTREVRPSLAPAGADKATFAEARSITREARAKANQAVASADRHAQGMKSRLAKLEKHHGVTHAQIAHALDTGSLDGLPAAAHAEVRDIAQRFDQLKQIRTEAGVKEGTIENYYPRAREDMLHAKHGIVSSDTEHAVGTGARRTAPTLGSSRTRVDPRPLHEVNAERIAEGKSPFSTDVPLVYANYARDTGRVVGENHALRELAKTGRAFHVGDVPKPNEALYHLGYEKNKLGLRPVKDGDPVHPGNGEYVWLDHKSIETVQKRIEPAQAAQKSGKAFDRTTAAFKRVATFTPGFHVRNAVGDTQMAYLSQPGHTLPRNIAQAAKINRANVRLEKSQRETLSGLVPDSGKTVKVAGKRMSVEQLARWAREDGVTNSGQIGRELKDLAVKGEAVGRVPGRVKSALRKPVAKVEPTVRGRENVIRLATYKHGLDEALSRGLDEKAARREAADLSLKTHIDYGDLTETERKVLRRAMPFYTFTARSTPLHLQKLITNPGKFANYEKLRENVATATGADLGTGLTDQQQRQAPLVAKIGGKTYTLGAGLPLASALDLAPVSKNPAKLASEVWQTAAGLANPVFKDPVEFATNTSFFFRNAIEQHGIGQDGLVAAPVWVKYLPASLKKQLYVGYKTDKRTGKQVLKWRGKADYVLKALTPGPGNIANQLLASGTNRAGQGGIGKALVGATGLKVQPVDPVNAAITLGFTVLDAKSQQLAALKPPDGVKPSKEYVRLKAEVAQDQKHIHDLSVKRGDKKPYFSTGKKKVDPLVAKYGLDSGSSVDALSKKYGLDKGTNVDALASKYGLK